MKQPQQTYCTAETRRSFDDEFKRQAIALMETGRPVRHLARELEVKASMLYAWSDHWPSRRVQEDQRLTDQILTLHTRSRHTYGSPRIRIELQAAGIGIGRRRIARIMRQQRIVGRRRKRRSPRTTHSHHDPSHRPQSALGPRSDPSH